MNVLRQLQNDCENDDTYKFKNKNGRDCDSWVANDLSRCKKKDKKKKDSNGKKLKVRDFCPEQCNDDCNEGRNDEADEERGNCENDVTYTFQNKNGKDCATFVSQNPKKFCKKKDKKK